MTRQVFCFACFIPLLWCPEAIGALVETYKFTGSTMGFGSSVGISGNTVIVGNPSFGGSAYLLDVTSGERLHKLTANDAAPNGVLWHIRSHTLVVDRKTWRLEPNE